MRAAWRRCSAAILAIALVHVLSVATGIVMVHAGNRWALGFRDRLVARAVANDPASVAYGAGHRVEAALWDFARNLTLGAIPQTITGLTVVSPYGFAAYRGWIGGIVSVDGHHRSRFATWRAGAYYLITLILQLIPYSIAMGVGVRLGMSYFTRASDASEKRYWGYPREAIADVPRLYALVVPLFVVASLWEFLSPWG